MEERAAGGGNCRGIFSAQGACCVHKIFQPDPEELLGGCMSAVSVSCEHIKSAARLYIRIATIAVVLYQLQIWLRTMCGIA